MRGKFFITRNNGKRELVQGDIFYDLFAVRKGQIDPTEKPIKLRWLVTHLPTGFIVGTFDLKNKSRKFIEILIEGELDWTDSSESIRLSEDHYFKVNRARKMVEE